MWVNDGAPAALQNWRARRGFEPGTSLTLSQIATGAEISSISDEIFRHFSGNGPVAQRIRHLTTNQGIAGSSPAKVNIFGQLMQPDKNSAPPGGLEPPTFRLTAERASQLRHGGFITVTAASPLELKSQNLLSCFQRTCALMRPQQASLSSVRYGLVVRIPGSHPGGPGSIPGNGKSFANGK